MTDIDHLSDTNSIIRTVAQKTKDLRLEVPFSIFLESIAPLRGLGEASLLFAAPFLQLLIGVEKVKLVEKLLSDPQNIKLLLEELNGRA